MLAGVLYLKLVLADSAHPGSPREGEVQDYDISAVIAQSKFSSIARAYSEIRGGCLIDRGLDRSDRRR
jgi:hypothetical protein